ncbi:hypothetical protein EUGRSUZ_B00557 [Eucalyptus grandis]|uniref:Uncharacterized protein n=2 Tax=Eucalyptus grandis TaxID=71139 RepID=A0ACC3LN67_EUCGR|nr:hypothetical protein EUGRSUZ_B00557 [Eucalyptus grandis]
MQQQHQEFTWCCLLIEDAHKAFDEMGERNNVLITGHIHNRKFVEPLDLFREMQADGVKSTKVTKVGALSACAHLGVKDQGPTRFFMAKNVYTWNALISGFTMNGRGEAALQAFSRMIMENLKPAGVTFLSILCACCYEGHVDEEKRYFRIMKEEFGLRPEIEHYECMVDLHGQPGLFSEPLHPVQNMDSKTDPIIWRNSPRHEARKLLELEPTNAENYFLLSNIYAQDSMWNEIVQLSAAMNQKALTKVAGAAQLKLTMLLMLHNTGLALYDIEEGKKKSSAAFHSEKNALAFDLVKSPTGSTLRIVKNHRVFQDCHEIGLRDRNQFHHFAGGSCSCRDHW